MTLTFTEESGSWCQAKAEWAHLSLVAVTNVLLVCPSSQLEEAKNLMRDAIAAGIFTDLGSGSNVDLCIITQAGVEFLRGFDQPAAQAKRWLSVALNVSWERWRSILSAQHICPDDSCLRSISSFLCVLSDFLQSGSVQVQARHHGCPHQNCNPPVCGHSQPVCPGHGHRIKHTVFLMSKKLEHKGTCVKTGFHCWRIIVIKVPETTVLCLPACLQHWSWTSQRLHSNRTTGGHIQHPADRKSVV